MKVVWEKIDSERERARARERERERERERGGGEEGGGGVQSKREFESRGESCEKEIVTSGGRGKAKTDEFERGRGYPLLETHREKGRGRKKEVER